MIYLIGSAEWLRTITNGDQFGRGITYPLWKDSRPERFFATDFFHPLALSRDVGELRPSVTDFRIEVRACPPYLVLRTEPRSRVCTNRTILVDVALHVTGRLELMLVHYR